MEGFWIENIYRSIKDISDLEYQSDAWFGKSSLVSSYSEIINILYDDNCFEDFINNSYWTETDARTSSFYSGLVLLNKMINAYKEPGAEEEIIKDPTWHSIVKQAKKVLTEWDLADSEEEEMTASHYLRKRLENIREYTQNDFETYKSIIDEKGDCSVGMICHAVAVIDLMSYIFYGELKFCGNELKPDRKVGKRWKKLLDAYSNNCTVPEWKQAAKNHDLMYNVIRCGVVHQFYGKGTKIKRVKDNNDIILKYKTDTIVINPDGLFMLVQDLIAKAIGWIDELVLSNESEITKIKARIDVRDAHDRSILTKALKGQSSLPSADPPSGERPTPTQPAP